MHAGKRSEIFLAIFTNRMNGILPAAFLPPLYFFPVVAPREKQARNGL
jgi:hypothetical protein